MNIVNRVRQSIDVAFLALLSFGMIALIIAMILAKLG
ncbi:hypothetical protein BH10PSE13_BH10PSE13_00560 [soil metagenome]